MKFITVLCLAFVPQLVADNVIESCEGASVILFNSTAKDLQITLYRDDTIVCHWDPQEGRSSECNKRVVRDEFYLIRIENVSKLDQGNYSLKPLKLPANNKTLLVSADCQKVKESDFNSWKITALVFIICFILLVILFPLCLCYQRSHKKYRCETNKPVELDTLKKKAGVTKEICRYGGHRWNSRILDTCKNDCVKKWINQPKPDCPV